MKVSLAYGKEGLEIDVPDSSSIVEPRFLPGLADEPAAIRAALREPISSRPLRDLLSNDTSVVLVFSDLTRPVPNRRLLPPILAEIKEAGVPSANVTLLNACGLHRPNTPAELDQMLGPEIVSEYRIVNHNARDRDQQVFLGKSSFGGEIWVDKEYLRAKVRILTGFIEPHFFAGFSGGAKSVLPGISGADTILHNHNAEMIGHPNTNWGITEGNPVFGEICQAESMAPCSFLVNVTLNDKKEITGVFAGSLRAAHDAGIAVVRSTAMRAVPQAYDIVVTTNSGYPLDLNLYQAVKGMWAAKEILREGGEIIIASECSEGVGQRNFGEIMQMRSNPQAWLDMIFEPGFSMIDQWEVQVLAKILLKSKVHIYAAGLSPEEARGACLEPLDDVSQTLSSLREQHIAMTGVEPRICILPQGPQTVPYVER